MFTGLIQDVGTVRAARAEGEGRRFELETRLAEILAVGDSLAVNGVCLTAEEVRAGVAAVRAVPETLARSTLGSLGTGSRVNLEPALRLSDRLGGHLVQGHVDGMGQIRAIVPRGDSREMTIEAESGLTRYVVEKGSIAVDGVSLTVAALGEGEFTVALVPHTLGATTLGERRAGEVVNLETDLLAKYVEKLLAARGEGSGGRITEAWLRDRGF